MRAAIYVRLSQEREGQTSTERQEADCRAWVARHHGEVLEVLADVGISGYAEVERPSFQSALEALRSGRVDTLVVWKLDRLSRRGIGQVGALLDDLERSGGRLVAVQDGIDTAQSGSRMVLALLAELARQESANTGVRVRSAKAHLARSGRWTGGRVPWGYRRDAETGRLVQEPEVASLVRLVAQRLTEGATLQEMAEWLNVEGHLRTPESGPWWPVRLGEVMRSPVLAGWSPTNRRRSVHRHEDGTPVEVTAEPILTPGEYSALQAALESRRPARGGRGRSPAHLLAGVLYCGECGYRMSATGGRWAAYVCKRTTDRPGDRSCPGVAIRIPLANDYVAQRALARLAALEPEDPTLEAVAARWLRWKAPHETAERLALEAALADAQARLAELEEARYVRGEFSGPDGLGRFRRLSAIIEGQVRTARYALDSSPASQADLGPLLDLELSREAWAVASPEDRRAILGLVVDSVTVRKADRLGARNDRIEIVWASATPLEVTE